MLVGTDGYPKTEREYGLYCIAGGGKDRYFNAKFIEIYGVRTQI